MHFVSFDELQELEKARDEGVADDHRHFGHTSTRGYIAPTPLHVSRRSSDSNHKSSFYHHFRNKCCGKLGNSSGREAFSACPIFVATLSHSLLLILAFVIRVNQVSAAGVLRLSSLL